MSGRSLTIPFIGFGLAFVAAATLQPVIGSFSKAYRISGDAFVAAAAPETTPTPISGIYAITVTPTLAATRPAPVPSATPTPATGSAETPTPRPSSPTVRPGASATRSATASASPSATATSSSTPSPTAAATSTPDPCGGPRDARLIFEPSSQSLRAIGAIRGFVQLQNQGRTGSARDVTLRVTVTRGAQYVSGLRLMGPAATAADAAQPGELRIGYLAPGEAAEVRFEATLSWTNAALVSTAAASPVELRIDVVSESCRPAATNAPLASALVSISPLPRPTPVRVASPVAVQAEVEAVGP